MHLDMSAKRSDERILQQTLSRNDLQESQEFLFHKDDPHGDLNENIVHILIAVTVLQSVFYETCDTVAIV